MIVKKKRSLSTRGPGRRDTCFVTDFFQIFAVYLVRAVENIRSQTVIFSPWHLFREISRVFGSARGLWVKFKMEEKLKICITKIQDGRQTRVYPKASTCFVAC